MKNAQNVGSNPFLEYIEKLRNETSFVGWTEDEKSGYLSGYLTALKSVEEKIKSIKSTQYSEIGKLLVKEIEKNPGKKSGFVNVLVNLRPKDHISIVFNGWEIKLYPDGRWEWEDTTGG